jgi:hypothetical protein
MGKEIVMDERSIWLTFELGVTWWPWFGNKTFVFWLIYPLKKFTHAITYPACIQELFSLSLDRTLTVLSETVFLSPCRQMPELYLKMNHEHFLPHL